MAQKLTALVIGNTAYPDAARLRNPVHDAEDAGAEITACGFAVDIVGDASLKNMESKSSV